MPALQSNGLYADSINRRGVIEPAYWSYNQGTMIGAGTLLYQAPERRLPLSGTADRKGRARLLHT